MTEEWTPSGRIHPARWAWTTAAATVLLAIELFAVVTLASLLATRGRGRPPLEALELGLLLGLVPVGVVCFVAWKVRRRGEEVDETASAIFGVLAVVVLGLGLASALLGVPSRRWTRLAVDTMLGAVGAALLVASIWVRHIPRPWWPRRGVSG